MRRKAESARRNLVNWLMTRGIVYADDFEAGFVFMYFVCFGFWPGADVKNMAGPSGEQFLSDSCMFAFVSDDSYKMQSLKLTLIR